MACGIAPPLWHVQLKGAVNPPCTAMVLNAGQVLKACRAEPAWILGHRWWPSHGQPLRTWTPHSWLEQILIGVVGWTGAALGCKGTCSWVAMPAAATHMHPPAMSAVWVPCRSVAKLRFSASLLVGKLWMCG